MVNDDSSAVASPRNVRFINVVFREEMHVEGSLGLLVTNQFVNNLTNAIGLPRAPQIRQHGKKTRHVIHAFRLQLSTVRTNKKSLVATISKLFNEINSISVN